MLFSFHTFKIVCFICISSLSDAQNSSVTSNASLCPCPDECNVNSYSPELSIAGLSLSSVEPFLSQYGDVVWENTEAQEIDNRVDETIFPETVELLQSLSMLHSQIRFVFA